MRTMEEEVPVEGSDDESLASLSSRAKFISDMLSDSDSSIDGRQSFEGNTTMTTISSEGPHTPRSPAPEYSEEYMLEIGFADEKQHHFRSASMGEVSPSLAKKVQEMQMNTVGPVGPHLFRSYSTSHTTPVAPITIPALPPTPTGSNSSPSPTAYMAIRNSNLITPPSDSEPVILPRPTSTNSAHSEYDIEEIRSWTTIQVCNWVAALGFEHELVERFERNDITGAILIDLKWADLKELDIQSFGKRIELWTEIHHLRARTLPTPRTPEAEFVRPSSRVSRNSSATHSPVARGRSGSASSGAPSITDVPQLLRNRSIRHEQIISEADEDTDFGSRSRSRPRPQLRRKAKKTNVRLPRRQVSVDSIIITSENEEAFAASLAKVADAPRKHRCKKHHKHKHSHTTDEEKTHKRKCSKGDRCHKHAKRERSASRISTEHGTIVIATTPSIADATTRAPRASALYSDADFAPSRPNSILASSDVLGPTLSREIRLQESTLQEIARMDPLENVKKFLTHQHLQHLEERRESPPPVPTKSANDMARARYSPPPMPRSHTAPPPPVPSMAGLDFTAPSRTQTPSFGLRSQGMERAQPPPSMNFSSPFRMDRTTTPFSEADVPAPCATPINVREQSQSVPPESNMRRYPTPTLESLRNPVRRGNPAPLNVVDENAEWEALDDSEVKMAPSPHMRTHCGWMKKRRTNWFRHEWPDYHFVLQGTQLGYAKDVGTDQLGQIDMDDYQVACSNSNSTKLAAAFKAGRIFGKKKDDEHTPGSYFFQLVPAADVHKGKRSKNIGKAHYFSVNSREERIDWMRELMLAKAIKQKKQGFEVEVNGEIV